MAYKSLDPQTAVEYVKSLDFFPHDAMLEGGEVGDGNLNLVFKICDLHSGKSLIIKQALPYVRCVGESWPLDLNRAILEANAFELQNRLAPGLVPRLYHKDEELSLLVMEDLSHLGVMRPGTLDMRKYPKFSEHLSTFMANTLFYTSDLYMDPFEKKAMVKKFMNPELCKITEDLICSDPYYDCERNIINPPLRPYLEQVFWKKNALRLEASKYKYAFLTEAQSLLHGDLHTGSIFASEEETKVFDPEFAFYGPAAFDPGLLIGNLLINYISWDGKDEPLEKIHDYRDYLISTVNDVYTLFEQKFIANWNKDARDVTASVSGYQQFYMRKLFVDTLAFAAMVMIRRVHGLAHNIDVDGIEDEERRKDVQIRILEMAEELMMYRDTFSTIYAVTGFVKARIF
ncbi:S-methyl-5-thioribose kinase [candidate division KSB3 bacterium]|uniref:Methylthioribose kinase n=1 Tax=candidate division KSB3 bacterium TaxID=2044937 RepID=A0A2G6E4Q2_9BACT|nr:MAG: S-methyl-5-thioribose kinase [candidate division KSB3 bacterium]PIE29348.1 MAG: S-methyl-5-thioribose kinase [candidate division KSB3 bacterium]